MPKIDGVEVPTLKEFNELKAIVTALKDQVAALDAAGIKDGHTVSMIARSEYLTWMTSGGEVKSRGTDYIPDMQGWKIQKR